MDSLEREQKEIAKERFRKWAESLEPKGTARERLRRWANRWAKDQSAQPTGEQPDDGNQNNNVKGLRKWANKNRAHTAAEQRDDGNHPTGPERATRDAAEHARASGTPPPRAPVTPVKSYEPASTAGHGRVDNIPSDEPETRRVSPSPPSSPRTPSYEARSPAQRIICLGNVNAGKSTILNILAHAHRDSTSDAPFLVGRQTDQLEIYQAPDCFYTDTPGLYSDDNFGTNDEQTYEAAARTDRGKEIIRALTSSTEFKLFFVFESENFRARPRDEKLVRFALKFCPAIDKSFGVLVNKLPQTMLEFLEIPSQKSKFIESAEGAILQKYFGWIPWMHPPASLANTPENARTDSSLSTTSTQPTPPVVSGLIVPNRVSDKLLQFVSSLPVIETVARKHSLPRTKSDLEVLNKVRKIPSDEIEISGVIRKGRFSTIYSGTWHQPCPVGNGRETTTFRVVEKMVVIKKPIRQPTRTAEEDTRMRMNELKILADHQHNNIVTLYGVCWQRQEQLCIYERMACDLKDAIDDDKLHAIRGARSRQLHIAFDIAAGMEWIHKYGVVHRELNPATVLLNDTYDGAKVADFGASYTMKNSRDHVVYKDDPTPLPILRYAAPETVLLGLKWGLSADVYSFGAILYLVVMKEVPFPRLEDQASIVQSLDRALTDEDEHVFPIPESLNGSHVPEFVKCMRECLLTRPGERTTFEVLHEFLKMVKLRDAQDLETLRRETSKFTEQERIAFEEAWKKVKAVANAGMLTDLQSTCRRLDEALTQAVRQPTNSATDLSARAKQCDDSFHTAMSDLLELSEGGVDYKQGGVKTTDRIIEKANMKYKGDCSQVLDVLRGCAVFQDIASLLKFLSSFEKASKSSLQRHWSQELWPVRFKDEYSTAQPSGLRQAVINFRFNDTIIGELQLALKPVYAVQSNPRSHLVYELVRNLEKPEMERNRTNPEKARYEESTTDDILVQINNLTKRFATIKGLTYDAAIEEVMELQRESLLDPPNRRCKGVSQARFRSSE
mmetsp:Transcript_941/g.2792  ORF Transcript_941/g.2792 Transcript_941/m.2792 type:complete len:1012 (-) Transcript_941:474-3509(-)